MLSRLQNTNQTLNMLQKRCFEHFSFSTQMASIMLLKIQCIVQKNYIFRCKLHLIQWIGLLGKIYWFKPHDLHGKIDGFRLRWSQQNQSIDSLIPWFPSEKYDSIGMISNGKIIHVPNHQAMVIEIVDLPSGELTFCHGTSPFLMGKSTIFLWPFSIAFC